MSGSCCPNLCPECGLIHHNATVEGCLRIQVKALRAEVERLKVAEGEAMLVVESQDVSIANLRAEVAGWHRSSADLLDQIHDLEQVAANLRAEVAALKAELSREDEPHDYCHHCGGRFGWLRAEIARLEAELAKYTEPLSDEQAARVVLGEYRATMNDWDRDKPALELAWDAAIRRVRGES